MAWALIFVVIYFLIQMITFKGTRVVYCYLDIVMMVCFIHHLQRYQPF